MERFRVVHQSEGKTRKKKEEERVKEIYKIPIETEPQNSSQHKM